MNGSNTITKEQVPSILDRGTLTEGIVKQLIDSSKEVKYVLDQFIDVIPVYLKNEKGELLVDEKRNQIVKEYYLGENSLINVLGLKRIRAMLTGFNNKDIGLGFRQDRSINLFILNNLGIFIKILQDNLEEWGVDWKDFFTIVNVIESFLCGQINKSYKGLSFKSIAGAVQSKESSTIQEQKKGIGGLFGGGNK